MLTSEYRPMTPEERARIESLAAEDQPRGCSKFLHGFACLSGCLLGSVFFAVVIAAILRILRVPESVLGWLFLPCVLLGLLLGVMMLRDEKAQASNARQKYLHHLADNRMEVLHCTASDAVEVEEFGDEGPGYFLDVGDSKLLFLQGQYLYDVAGKRFPNREFDVIRLPGIESVFDIQCLGEPFTPSRVRGPLLSDKEYIPYDGEVIMGALRTLETDLRNLKRIRHEPR